LLDSTIRLGDQKDVWAIELIGRKPQQQTLLGCLANVPFTGGGTGTAAGVWRSFRRGQPRTGTLLQIGYKFSR